ncbi:MAG TPA: hypothetical protein VN648_34175, partial [Candidatus Methylomirabilis sp.]|nr:hypothetical protein [Candidatus Methylomirabilis sp.]
MSGTYLNPGGTKLLSGFTQSWRQFQGAGKWLLVVCAILLGTGSARANTYLFSVSASQLLTALASDPDESTSGYFAIFVQPSQVTQSYSYTNVTAPNPPPGAEAWNATTITDPSLGTGTFAQFEQGQTQTQIMLLSNDTNWNSRFSGRVYSDTSTYPFGWG